MQKPSLLLLPVLLACSACTGGFVTTTANRAILNTTIFVTQDAATAFCLVRDMVPATGAAQVFTSHADYFGSFAFDPFPDASSSFDSSKMLPTGRLYVVVDNPAAGANVWQRRYSVELDHAYNASCDNTWNGQSSPQPCAKYQLVWNPASFSYYELDRSLAIANGATLVSVSPTTSRYVEREAYLKNPRLSCVFR